MGELRSGREISRAPIASIATSVAGGGNASDARGVRHRNGIVLHNEKGPPAMTREAAPSPSARRMPHVTRGARSPSGCAATARHSDNAGTSDARLEAEQHTKSGRVWILGHRHRL